jgi:hypothetical protein
MCCKKNWMTAMAAMAGPKSSGVWQLWILYFLARFKFLAECPTLSLIHDNKAAVLPALNILKPGPTRNRPTINLVKVSAGMMSIRQENNF